MARKIKVRPILELRYAGKSYNEIAIIMKTSKHSAIDVCRKAEELGMDANRIQQYSEEELYEMFFPEKVSAEAVFENVDYEYVHKELLKTGVTLKLLHEEYAYECRKKCKVAVSYAKYCRDYGRYTGSRNMASHLEHKPGDRIEVGLVRSYHALL